MTGGSYVAVKIPSVFGLLMDEGAARQEKELHWDKPELVQLDTVSLFLSAISASFFFYMLAFSALRRVLRLHYSQQSKEFFHVMIVQRKVTAEMSRDIVLGEVRILYDYNVISRIDIPQLLRSFQLALLTFWSLLCCRQKCGSVQSYSTTSVVTRSPAKAKSLVFSPPSSPMQFPLRIRCAASPPPLLLPIRHLHLHPFSYLHDSRTVFNIIVFSSISCFPTGRCDFSKLWIA